MIARRVESVHTAPVKIPKASPRRGSFIANLIVGGVLFLVAVGLLIYGVTL